nr:ribonuclease H-like domain-containing protein [Tanacetum cinerariifolium]
MAALRYRDEHNKVGYLLKPTGSDDYHHQIINFLRASHIRYALTHDPIIFDSLVKQLWSTATLRSPELADDGGIDNFPIAEIYSGMDNIGYVTEGKLTFFKNKLSPQWRFLVHTILHCLSTKSGSWDQFGSPLTVALICLSDGRQFNWSSYIFKGMGHPMPLLAAMLHQDQEGESAGVAAQAISQPMPAPNQPQDHLSTPSRQQTSNPNAPMNLWEALFICLHQGPLKLPLQKVNSLKTELKDHKKLFKDVVGKLVKKVKALEVKLRTKKRKMVVSDSDQEEGGQPDVDLDALLALANAAVTVDSNIPPGGASDTPAASTSVPADVPTRANVSTGSTSVPADVPPSAAPAGVSNKRKTPMVEEDIPVKERTFKQMQEDILGEQAAKRLHDEEQAQVKANASLSKTLLGDDVFEDNFLARMAASIKRKKEALVEKLAKERRNRPMTQAQQRAYMRQFVKNQSSAVYSTRWSMAYVKSFIDDQLKEEFEKIRKAQSNIQIQAFSRTLKRTSPVLEEPSSKQKKSTEAPISSVPEVPQSPVVSSPKSSGTRRKSLGRTHLTKPKSKLAELDLAANDQRFIKVVSNEDSEDEAPPLWFALIDWEVIPTPLGDINALYRIDRSTKHFTTLRQILHMVDRQDLVKLYGLVVKYYKNHPVVGVGLILWGDLKVLFDSQEGGKGSFVWQNQHLWQIRSWRLYTLSNVHVLETVSGEVVYMFVDVSYPFSVKLMERMLKHKLEIDKDVVGNDMTTAEQLIQFIKNQLAAAQVSSA